MNYLYYCCFAYLVTLSYLQAQVFPASPLFTFADTPPVNKVDSLEEWLNSHRNPTHERLMNLVRLEKTWYINYPEKSGNRLNEIKNLAERMHSYSGKAAYEYLSAMSDYLNEKKSTAIKHLLNAHRAFVAIHDTSGIIHTYAAFIVFNYNEHGGNNGDEKLMKSYLDKIIDLQQKTKNPHDYITVEIIRARYLYGQRPFNIPEMRKHLQKANRFIDNNPSYQYAQVRLTTSLAISYYLDNNFVESYRLNRRALSLLFQNQAREKIRLYHNLANDCFGLSELDNVNRLDEIIGYCQQSLRLYETFKLRFPKAKMTALLDYREALNKNNQFKKANILADSILYYRDFIYAFDRDKLLLELQSQYEFDHSKKQITELQNQALDAQLQSRQRLVVSSIIAMVAVIFGFLVNRLLKGNQKLKTLQQTRDRFFGIIAHDLRSPFQSFQGLAGVITHLLKTQQYSRINEVAQQLDSSSLQMEMLLNNLLKWALSQQEIIPYKPIQVLVYPKLKAIINIFTPLLAYKKQHIHVVCPNDLVLTIDPDALDLIIRNLIQNAIKALPENGEITISANQVNDRKIQIQITDNGPGFDINQLTFIQHWFSGLEQATVGEHGIGLGLQIIKEFTQCNNGIITLVSQPGIQTSFLLTFPTTVPVHPKLFSTNSFSIPD